jgi:hypothetical protein
MAPVNDGLLAGARKVVPASSCPGGHAITDDAAWLQAGDGHSGGGRVSDNRQRWLHMPATLSVEVLPTIDSSIQQLDTYLQDLPVARTPVIAATAAHADTPELVTWWRRIPPAAPACEACSPRP